MRNELTGYLLLAEEYGEVFVKEGIVFVLWGLKP